MPTPPAAGAEAEPFALSAVSFLNSMAVAHGPWPESSVRDRRFVDNRFQPGRFGAAMKSKFNCGICVLAGGLSARIGRNKARLRLGQRTMLGQIRAVAKTIGLPLRVIRRD